MDLLASIPPAALGRFNAIPSLCLGEVSVEPPRFSRAANGSWHLFTYGCGSTDGSRVLAATPVDSKLGPHLSTDPEKNLALVVSLVKHAEPANFFGHVSKSCGNNASADHTTHYARMRSWRLPYQVEYAQDYEFDPARCGKFLGEEPCWFDLGFDSLHEPGMVLVPPKSVPREQCFNPGKGRGGAEGTNSSDLTKVLDLIKKGEAWHPDEICPDYRLMCGSKLPPNLPRELRPCGGPTSRWIQIPRFTCEADDDARCAGLRLLDEGRLPLPLDDTMEWLRVDGDIEVDVCRAPSLASAKRTADSLLTYNLCGDNIFRIYAPQASTSNPRGAIPQYAHLGWTLFRDHQGNLEFVQRGVGNSRHSSMCGALVLPLSEKHKIPLRDELEAPPRDDTQFITDVADGVRKIDVLTSLSGAAGRAYAAIQLICLGEIGEEDDRSKDGLWKIFRYGYSRGGRLAATPANGSLAPKLSREDPEHNLRLVVSLVKHTANPSDFIAHPIEPCSRSEEDAIQMNADHQRMSLSQLPYQVLYAEKYRFNTSHCGEFLDDNPCWFDMANQSPYEPGLVLLPPGLLPASECYKENNQNNQNNQNDQNNRTSQISRKSRNNRNSSRADVINEHNKTEKRTPGYHVRNLRARRRALRAIANGNAWLPEDICPDWRLICGALTPPNLPHKLLARCKTRLPRWVQALGLACGADDSPDCMKLSGLKAGRLPSYRDRGMRWVNLYENSRMCKAATMLDFRYVLDESDLSWGDYEEQHDDGGGKTTDVAYHDDEDTNPYLTGVWDYDDESWPSNFNKEKCSQGMRFLREIVDYSSTEFPGDPKPRKNWDLVKEEYRKFRFVPHQSAKQATTPPTNDDELDCEDENEGRVTIPRLRTRFVFGAPSRPFERTLQRRSIGNPQC